MLKAAELLRDTSRTVADITLAVGYDDTEANFSNAFRDWCGLYPTPYRVLARELLKTSSRALAEVFTLESWQRLHRRELAGREARVMTRLLETVASAVATAEVWRRHSF